jgi:hypothetical protein
MSSPLDGRIRTLAREEATALLGVGTPTATAGTDPQLAALEKEVAELRSRLDALEKTPAKTVQDAPTGTRRTRKTAE